MDDKYNCLSYLLKGCQDILLNFLITNVNIILEECLLISCS